MATATVASINGAFGSKYGVAYSATKEVRPWEPAATSLADLSAVQLSAQLAVVATSLQVMQAALPLLRRCGAGRIINIGHRYGETVNAESGAYGAAVGALWALTRSAAVECSEFDITSNLLVPFAETPEFQEVLYGDGEQHIVGPVLNPAKFAARR